MITIHISSNYVNTCCNLNRYCCGTLYMNLVVQNVKLASNRGNCKLQQGYQTCMMINIFFLQISGIYIRQYVNSSLQTLTKWVKIGT